MLDLSNQRWTIEADVKMLPNLSLSYKGLVVKDHTMYFNDKDNLFGYDTKNQVMFRETALPAAALGGSPCLVEDKIYLLGNDIYPYTSKLVHIWDLTSKTWSRGPDMLNARRNIHPLYHNGKLYVMGPSNECEALDIARGTWHSIAPKNTGSQASCCVLANSKIYVYQGQNMTIYDIASDSWSTPVRTTFGNDNWGTAYDGGIIIVTGVNQGLIFHDLNSNSFHYLKSLAGISGKQLCVIDDVLYNLGNAGQSNTSGIIFSLRLTDAPAPLDYIPELGVAPTDTAQLAVHQDLAKNADYSWATADSGIASVDGAGLLTAVASGKTRATVSSSALGYSQSMTVYVPEP